ncbi:acyltransferase [Pontibacter oryzae]|uniref:Acyltransferase n=1 Tax=Pontibacter oryzae TaxID=2304593 RepID=A0A399SHL5_9BACT|nr:acyltransferase [Pontibacter oryzae]RIJ42521.1 acyltransferase [Pontibacter oryzae]
MAQFVQLVKQNPKYKSLALYLLMPARQARPRWWVRKFLNPFIHRRGAGARICRSTRIDVMPFQPFSLGAGSTIEDFSTINNGMGAVLIGERSRVGIGSVLIGPVEVGNDVILAQHVVLSGLNHSYEAIDIPIKNQTCTTARIVVEDEAWIGANSVITAGVRIGKHAVVAGGSVVTKDVAPYTVVGGNPARILKRYNPATAQWERANSNHGHTTN